jgi:hypothetical protein
MWLLSEDASVFNWSNRNDNLTLFFDFSWYRQAQMKLILSALIYILVISCQGNAVVQQEQHVLKDVDAAFNAELRYIETHHFNAISRLSTLGSTKSLKTICQCKPAQPKIKNFFKK